MTAEKNTCAENWGIKKAQLVRGLALHLFKFMNTL